MGGMSHVHAHSYPVYEGFRHIVDPYWYGESEDGESPEAFGLRAARALEEEIWRSGPRMSPPLPASRCKGRVA
jgi:putrescine aminotransferase